MFDEGDPSSSDTDSSSSSCSSSSPSSCSSSSVPVLAMQGVPAVTHAMVKAVASVTKKVPEGIRMSYVKSLTNAWATSSRYQEVTKLPCLFGCPCKRDSLKHYLRCKVLWSTIECVTGFVVNMEQPTVVRLGLHDPNLAKIYLQALAFRIYHNVKLHNLEFFKRAIELGDQATLQERLVSITRAQWAEIK